MVNLLSSNLLMRGGSFGGRVEWLAHRSFAAGPFRQVLMQYPRDLDRKRRTGFATGKPGYRNHVTDRHLAMPDLIR
jgi:hypothetical protein